MGQGALLLGHNHPVVTRAIVEALRDGTHFSADHPMELAWAERIKRLVPSVELVRFVSSGTEANMMAIRLARLRQHWLDARQRESDARHPGGCAPFRRHGTRRPWPRRRCVEIRRDR